MGRSLPLRVYRTRLVAHLGLAFASAPRLRRLTSPRTSNSPDHYAKGTPSAAPGPKSRLSLRPLVSTWFQVLFHSPPGVLFTFPSRYWFTIGRQRVFSLGGWSLRIPARFHVSRGTWERAPGSQRYFRLPDFHRLWSDFPVCSTSKLVFYSPTPLPGIRTRPATPTAQRWQALTRRSV